MLDRAAASTKPGATLLAVPAVAVLLGLLLPALALLLLPLVDFVAAPRVLDGVAPTPTATFDPQWFGALATQLTFTALVLAIEVPVGVLVALAMPRRGVGAGLAATIVAMPLVLPQSFFELVRTEFGPRLTGKLNAWVAGAPVGWHPSVEVWEWTGYVLVDAWRFTPLVVLLCAFALRRDDRLELAARIDGLSVLARVRHVHWPRMRAACALAVLLRIVDSCAAWPAPGAGISLAAWVRDRAVAGPGTTAALAAALTLLLLLFVPSPLPATDREAR
jgi:glycerol transport system permease protein